MVKRLVSVVPGLLFPLMVLAGCGTSATTTATTTPTTVAPTTTTTAGTSVPPTSVSTTRPGAPATTVTTKAGGPLPTGTSSTTVAPYTGTVSLSDSDSGATIRLTRGTTIVVVLASTYWMFPTAPNAAVLEPIGGVTTSLPPVGTCIPGGGCGTESVTYKAVGAGQATISASRTTCGEARTCTGNQGSYSVQVVVSAG